MEVGIPEVWNKNSPYKGRERTEGAWCVYRLGFPFSVPQLSLMKWNALNINAKFRQYEN